MQPKNSPLLTPKKPQESLALKTKRSFSINKALLNQEIMQLPSLPCESLAKGKSQDPWGEISMNISMQSPRNLFFKRTLFNQNALVQKNEEKRLQPSPNQKGLEYFRARAPKRTVLLQYCKDKMNKRDSFAKTIHTSFLISQVSPEKVKRALLKPVSSLSFDSFFLKNTHEVASPDAELLRNQFENIKRPVGSASSLKFGGASKKLEKTADLKETIASYIKRKREIHLKTKKKFKQVQKTVSFLRKVAFFSTQKRVEKTRTVLVPTRPEQPKGARNNCRSPLLRKTMIYQRNSTRIGEAFGIIGAQKNFEDEFEVENEGESPPSSQIGQALEVLLEEQKKLQKHFSEKSSTKKKRKEEKIEEKKENKEKNSKKRFRAIDALLNGPHELKTGSIEGGNGPFDSRMNLKNISLENIITRSRRGTLNKSESSSKVSSFKGSSKGTKEKLTQIVRESKMNGSLVESSQKANSNESGSSAIEEKQKRIVLIKCNDEVENWRLLELKGNVKELNMEGKGEKNSVDKEKYERKSELETPFPSEEETVAGMRHFLLKGASGMEELKQRSESLKAPIMRKNEGNEQKSPKSRIRRGVVSQTFVHSRNSRGSFAGLNPSEQIKESQLESGMEQENPLPDEKSEKKEISPFGNQKGNSEENEPLVKTISRRISFGKLAPQEKMNDSSLPFINRKALQNTRNEAILNNSENALETMELVSAGTKKQKVLAKTGSIPDLSEFQKIPKVHESFSRKCSVPIELDKKQFYFNVVYPSFKKKTQNHSKKEKKKASSSLYLESTPKNEGNPRTIIKKTKMNK